MSHLGPDLGVPHHPHFSGGQTAHYQSNQLEGAMARANTARGAPIITALFGKGALNSNPMKSLTGGLLEVSLANHANLSSIHLLQIFGLGAKAGLGEKIFGVGTSSAAGK